MKYRSIAVPVSAIQWNSPNDYDTHINDNYDYYIEDSDENELYVNPTDWIILFPDGEIHVVKDKFFKIRFEATEKFTKKELDYAERLAQIGDCD